MNIKDIEVTKTEFAEFIGINNNAVTKMCKAGLPVLSNKKLNLQQATSWYINQQKSVKSQTQESARTKLIEAQTRRIKLQILEKRGDLVEIESVKGTIVKVVESIKNQIQTLVTRLPVKLENKSAVQITEILKTDVNKALSGIKVE